MRMIALLAPFLLIASCSAPPDFEADFSAAQANVRGEPGRSYDQAFAKAVQTDAHLAVVMDCMRTHRDLVKQSHRGVIRFGADSGYTIEMRPDNPLTQCLASAYGGHAVPEPPERPYLLPIEH